MEPHLQQALCLLFQITHLNTRGVKIPDHISNLCDQIYRLLSWMGKGEKEQQDLKGLLSRLESELYPMQTAWEKSQ